MFTVVICGDSLISNIEKKYSYILNNLVNSKDFAFCPWNIEANTLDGAVPGLRKLIADKSEWRAIIIQDGETFGRQSIDKLNPFDQVGTLNQFVDFGDSNSFIGLSEEEKIEKINDFQKSIYEFRARKQENYSIASDSPITRMTLWLMGSGMKNKPELLNEWPESLMDDLEEVDNEYYEKVQELFLTSSDIETVRALLYKYEVLNEKFLPGSLLEKKPSNILLLSERSNYCEDERFKSVWEKHEELEYSNFCDDNMYPDQARYFLYDVDYENNIRNGKKYLEFLHFIIILAQNEIPTGNLQPYKVYLANLNMNISRASEIFSDYISKLEITKSKLKNEILREQKKENVELSNAEAQKIFESNVMIPVQIPSDFSKNEFMAEYKSIGLATDCPRDEATYWDAQYNSIQKLFIRFLRQPRRSVKRAVNDDFRNKNFIDDDRIVQLTSDQLDDITYRMQEEELNMVETSTTNLFNAKEYNKKLDEADKNLKRGIAQRMTRKKTIIVSLIAVFTYLIGFLPLIFSNINTFESFISSVQVTAYAMLIFVLCGLICLFVLRKRLINRFKHFNYVMSGIYTEIENGLRMFSKYLGHACNVMREFSVLNTVRETFSKKLRILLHHQKVLNDKLDASYEILSEYINDDKINRNIEPYNYDFSVLCDYDYEIPFPTSETIIEFVQSGNEISVPVDYIDSITMTREELYD